MNPVDPKQGTPPSTARLPAKDPIGELATDALGPRDPPQPLTGRAVSLPSPAETLAQRLRDDPNPKHWKVVQGEVHYYEKGPPLIGKGTPSATCSIAQLQAAVQDPRTQSLFQAYCTPEHPPVALTLLFSYDPDLSHWRVHQGRLEYYAQERDKPLFGTGKPLCSYELSDTVHKAMTQHVRARLLQCQTDGTTLARPLEELRKDWNGAETLVERWNQLCPNTVDPRSGKPRLCRTFATVAQHWEQHHIQSAASRTFEQWDRHPPHCELEQGEPILCQDSLIDERVLIKEKLPLSCMTDHLVHTPDIQQTQRWKAFLKQEQLIHPECKEFQVEIDRCDRLLTPRPADPPVPTRVKQEKRKVHFPGDLATPPPPDPTRQAISKTSHRAKVEMRKTDPLLDRNATLRSLGTSDKKLWQVKGDNIIYTGPPSETYPISEVRALLISRMEHHIQALDSEIDAWCEYNATQKDPKQFIPRDLQYPQRQINQFAPLQKQLARFNELVSSRDQIELKPFVEMHNTLIGEVTGSPKKPHTPITPDVVNFGWSSDPTHLRVWEDTENYTVTLYQPSGAMIPLEKLLDYLTTSTRAFTGGTEARDERIAYLVKLRTTLSNKSTQKTAAGIKRCNELIQHLQQKV